MLVQHILHAVDAEPLTFGAGKQHLAIPSLGLSKPSFQDRECRFGDGCTSFLASLADDAHVSAGSDDEIRTFQSGHF